METRKKIGLLVLLVLFPVFILLDHIFLYPIPLSTLPFVILLSSVVVLLVFFSHGMKVTMIIPIIFLLIGFFLVLPSTIGKGTDVYSFMGGTFFMMIGLVTAIFVVASSYKKP